jgi:hypothetical protein
MKRYPVGIRADPKKIELRIDLLHSILHGRAAQRQTVRGLEGAHGLGRQGVAVFDDMGFVDDDAIRLRVEEKAFRRKGRTTLANGNPACVVGVVS